MPAASAWSSVNSAYCPSAQSSSDRASTAGSSSTLRPHFLVTDRADGAGRSVTRKERPSGEEESGAGGGRDERGGYPSLYGESAEFAGRVCGGRHALRAGRKRSARCPGGPGVRVSGG